MNMLRVLNRPMGQTVGLRHVQRPLTHHTNQRPLVRSLSSLSRPSGRRPCTPGRTSLEPFAVVHRHHRYSSHHSRQRPLLYLQPSPATKLARASLQWGFIAACVYCWDQWQNASRQRHLRDNLVISERNLRAGRWWTLVTSAFSHKNLFHLAGNMVSYNAFTTAAWILGLSPLGVAAVGLASAVSCSCAQLADWRRKGVVHAEALGASGLVAGLGGYVTVLAPRLSFSIYFVPIGIPLWALTPALLAWDLYNTSSLTSGIGHAGHVGGTLCGLLLGFARRALFRF